MQLFSADATIFLKEILKFFGHEIIKTCPQKLLIISPNFFLQYCLPAQNQPKSQFLFQKNCSPRELCIMTLP